MSMACKRYPDVIPLGNFPKVGKGEGDGYDDAFFYFQQRETRPRVIYPRRYPRGGSPAAVAPRARRTWFTVGVQGDNTLWPRP